MAFAAARFEIATLVARRRLEWRRAIIPHPGSHKFTRFCTFYVGP
jgi:hypothetical protein